MGDWNKHLRYATRPMRKARRLRHTTQTGPMNSGPGLTQAGRCVLLAKCFWKTQQSPKAAPFHPPSLKEELWLSTYEYNFILLKDVKIKRHDALNKGYVNRNTFITKKPKKTKNKFTLY